MNDFAGVHSDELAQGNGLVGDEGFFEGGEAIDVSVGMKGEEAPVVIAYFKAHSDAFVEPAREAVFEMLAVELMPALVAEGSEGALSAYIISDTGAFEAICSGFYLEMRGGLLTREIHREFFPLETVGEEIDGELGFGFEWDGQLALVAAICAFQKAGDL